MYRFTIPLRVKVDLSRSKKLLLNFSSILVPKKLMPASRLVFESLIIWFENRLYFHSKTQLSFGVT